VFVKFLITTQYMLFYIAVYLLDISPSLIYKICIKYQYTTTYLNGINI